MKDLLAREQAETIEAQEREAEKKVKMEGKRREEAEKHVKH